MKRWVVFRTLENQALLTLRLRARGRWCSPPILCVSIESAYRLTPVGMPLVRFA